jgi:hypothetical protein
MPSSPALRRNFLLLLVVITGFILLGIDRWVDLPLLRAPAVLLYEWAIVLSAFALLLGLGNVVWVHLRQIRAGAEGWPYSLVLIITLVVVLGTGLAGPAGVRSPLTEMLFDAIIAPGQATLFALLALSMGAAAYRYLRIGRPGGAWLLAGVLLVFAVQMPIAHALLPPFVGATVAWVVDVPAMAAMRGALLGSSFALALVALRFLITSR